MPLSLASNNDIIGLHKQTNEATVGTVADYSFPLLTGDHMAPVQDTAAIQVTDAASIVGDSFKNAGEHWEGMVVTPAFDAMLGTMLVSMWPTDTPSGVAPSRLHTFTGLGSTPPWMSMYENFASASLSQTFAKGICSGIEFEFDTTRPLRVTYHMVGETPSVAAFTVTVAQTLLDGFFAPLAPANTLLKFDEDTSTPATHTNIVSGKISVMRDVTPLMTADGATVNFLAQGLLVVSGHLQVVWTDWDAFKTTYYQAAAGTTAGATWPAGSVDLLFGHTTSATSLFEIKLDKCLFSTTAPAPDPQASPLLMDIDLLVNKPAAGDHCKMLLTNNVTPAY
jgi:hypothetical protein